MSDREKLVELISKTPCIGDESKTAAEHVADHLIAHGVMVRQMQKPLTVEELMEIPGSVWYENDTAIAPMMVSNRKSFSVLYLKDVVFGLYRSSAFDSFTSLELPILDYAKTWRCWAKKPTEEERQNAKWEE